MTYWYAHRLVYLSTISRGTSFGKWWLTQRPAISQHAENRRLTVMFSSLNGMSMSSPSSQISGVTTEEGIATTRAKGLLQRNSVLPKYEFTRVVTACTRTVQDQNRQIPSMDRTGSRHSWTLTLSKRTIAFHSCWEKTNQFSLMLWP